MIQRHDKLRYRVQKSSIVIGIFVLGLLAIPSRSLAAPKIVDIEVAENTKTRDETVLLIADVSKGDTYTDDLPQRITQDLVTSGLFKDVNVFSTPVPEGGVKLIIEAKDKHSWIIAPTVYNQPTNKGGGIGFGENNLFGENKKILLYGQIATGDTFFIGAYVDPSLAGSRFNWQLDVFLRRERVIELFASDLVSVRFGPGQAKQDELPELGDQGGGYGVWYDIA